MKQGLRSTASVSEPHRRAASFQPKSRSRKIAKVSFLDRGRGGKLEPVAEGPFVSTTYISITATCPRDCPFIDAGCYAYAGASKRLVRRLDVGAVGLSSREVILQEVALIDGAFRGGTIPQDGGRGGKQGRDLRLHMSGDVRTAEDANLLAGAAKRWQERGGGVVWTYTHSWRQIPREAWGAIKVLASVEYPADISVAWSRGHQVAAVVDFFEGPKAFNLPGSTVQAIPCPAQTLGTNCNSCRLCFDDLSAREMIIAFAAHGAQAAKVRQKLKTFPAQTKRRLPVLPNSEGNAAR